MCDEISCTPNAKGPAIVVSDEQRRLFLKGLASLPLATVLAYPEFALAEAERTETVSLSVGGNTVSAALALPEADSAPTVLLIHEWWGLNPQIKSVASELAKLGYVALAVDLYQGKVAKDADGARALMKSVNGAEATNTLTAWIDYLKNHPKSSGKVGTLGWCFGGGWSLNASLATAVDATVIYYGNVKKDAAALKSLQSPVLGHFATEDQWINQEMVSGFEAAMKAAGKTDLAVHWYEAKHAFANPTSARYDAEDAALSWARTTEFFKKHLS